MSATSPGSASPSSSNHGSRRAPARRRGLDQLGVRVDAAVRRRAGAVEHDAGRRASPRRRAASTVSNVWFTVPSPARATTTSGQAEAAGEIGDRPALADRHEQAARTLDEQDVVPRRERVDGRGDGVELERAPLEPRRPRAAPAAPRTRTGRSRPGRPRPPPRACSSIASPSGSSAAAPALHRLRDPDVEAGRRERPRERRSATTVFPTSVSVAVTKRPFRRRPPSPPRPPARGCRASPRDRSPPSPSGGTKVTTSPRGRVIMPSSRARRQTRWPTASVQSNASLVARSRTSSIPIIKPALADLADVGERP